MSMNLAAVGKCQGIDQKSGKCQGENLVRKIPILLASSLGLCQCLIGCYWLCITFWWTFLLIKSFSAFFAVKFILYNVHVVVAWSKTLEVHNATWVGMSGRVEGKMSYFTVLGECLSCKVIFYTYCKFDWITGRTFRLYVQQSSQFLLWHVIYPGITPTAAATSKHKTGYVRAHSEMFSLYFDIFYFTYVCTFVILSSHTAAR